MKSVDYTHFCNRVDACEAAESAAPSVSLARTLLTELLRVALRNRAIRTSLQSILTSETRAEVLELASGLEHALEFNSRFATPADGCHEDDLACAANGISSIDARRASRYCLETIQ